VVTPTLHEHGWATYCGDRCVYVHPRTNVEVQLAPGMLVRCLVRERSGLWAGLVSLSKDGEPHTGMIAVVFCSVDLAPYASGRQEAK
jgi:hypothetical protein